MEQGLEEGARTAVRLQIIGCLSQLTSYSQPGRDLQLFAMLH